MTRDARDDARMERFKRGTFTSRMRAVARAVREATRGGASRRSVTSSSSSSSSSSAANEACEATAYATNEEDALRNLLTPAQRARRAALLAATTCAAGLYVSYFATPIIADGSARSFERLTRSRDGFLSRTGTARAATMWTLGDVANARGALVANDVVGACVETVCRDGMDWRARLEASAFLATAAEDARGAAAVRERRDVLEARAKRKTRGRWWWWGEDAVTVKVDAAVGVLTREEGEERIRANIETALRRAR